MKSRRHSAGSPAAVEKQLSSLVIDPQTGLLEQPNPFLGSLILPFNAITNFSDFIVIPLGIGKQDFDLVLRFPNLPQVLHDRGKFRNCFENLGIFLNHLPRFFRFLSLQRIDPHSKLVTKLFKLYLVGLTLGKQFAGDFDSSHR